MADISGAATPSVGGAGSAAQSPASDDAKSSQPMSGATQLKSKASSAEQSALLITHEIKLDNLSEIFAIRGKEAHVRKLLSDAATLRAWQSEAHPSNQERDAMTKHCATSIGKH